MSSHRRADEVVPVPVLDRAAVRELLDETESTEYCLVAHNRGIESVSMNAWGALPGVKGRGTTTVPKLRSLDLSFNRIAELDVAVLTPLGELRELKLYSNILTDEVCGLFGSGAAAAAAAAASSSTSSSSSSSSS